MSGFAQGLLAGFSTVDQAMTRRKELGLREAQLAQQQKNNERDFEFAQSQFEHNKDVDQRNFDYRAKVDDRNYTLQEWVKVSPSPSGEQGKWPVDSVMR